MEHTENNRYQTPLHIASYMASLVRGGSFIFEPTPGNGNLVRVLRVNGNTVGYPTDNYFDMREMFLESDIYDCVVMNAPFSSKSADLTNAPQKYLDAKGMMFGYVMLTEMMLKVDKVIALVPWFTISDSDVRLRRLKRYGLKSVTLLPRKTFDYARIQTVVLDLEKGYKGETKFLVYDTLKDEFKPKLEL